MPSKIRPDDWDRLFAPNAPRRGGPLRALLTILVTVAVIALLGVGVVYGFNYRQERFAQAAATATAYAPTAAAIRTATAVVYEQATATLVTALTATAQAKLATPTPTPEAGLAATVANGGNVREAPINGRPLAQANAGETVRLLAKTQDGGWFKVTYARNGTTITGWVSRTLLTIDPAVEQQVPVG